MKYRIKDENNNEFEIEEVVDTDETVVKEEESMTDDEATLTSEEIAALKLLAAKATDLLACLEKPAVTDEDTTNEDKEDDKEEEVTDGCKDAETEEEEEVKEEIKKANDSKAAFGANAKTKDSKKITDSDIQIEIAEAWRNRGKN